MTLRVSGKNFDIGESLRNHVIGRTEEAVSKYFAGTYTGHVTVEKEGSGFRTEGALHLSSGITLQAVGTSGDPYHACDQAVMRIERRLQRYKRKLKDRKSGGGKVEEHQGAYRVLELPARDVEEVPEDFAPTVVAEATTTYRTLTVSEAVMELDMSDRSFVIFRNAAHGGINVIHRRHDGHVGWIDPSLP